MSRDYGKEGWPRLLRDVRDFAVETRRVFHTGQLVIPAGTKGVVNSNGSNWDMLVFTSNACGCCGVCVKASRLSRNDLRPLKKDSLAPLNGEDA